MLAHPFQGAADVCETLNAYLQKTDPSFNSQRLSDWMHELFAEDIDEDAPESKLLEIAPGFPVFEVLPA